MRALTEVSASVQAEYPRRAGVTITIHARHSDGVWGAFDADAAVGNHCYGMPLFAVTDLDCEVLTAGNSANIDSGVAAGVLSA